MVTGPISQNTIPLPVQSPQAPVLAPLQAPYLPAIENIPQPDYTLFMVNLNPTALTYGIEPLTYGIGPGLQNGLANAENGTVNGDSRIINITLSPFESFMARGTTINAQA